MIREAAFANQEGTDEFPSAMKRIIEEKRYLTEQNFNADKSALFWKNKKQTKKSHRGYLLVRKRSEHYNLMQKGLGQLTVLSKCSQIYDLKCPYLQSC